MADSYVSMTFIRIYYIYYPKAQPTANKRKKFIDF